MPQGQQTVAIAREIVLEIAVLEVAFAVAFVVAREGAPSQTFEKMM